MKRYNEIMRTLLSICKTAVFTGLLCSAIFMESGFAQTPGVFSPPVYKQSFGTFQFENDVEGWEPEIRARLIHTEGILEIQSSEGNPGFYRLFDARCDQLRLRMRIRTRVESECEIYWLTREIPQRDSTRMVKVRLAADDHWNDYEIHLPINGQLSCISMKMIGPAGSWFLDSVDLYATISHPLSVIHAGRESNGIRFTVFNSTLNSVDFLEEGSSGIHTLSPRSSVGIFIPLEEKDNLARAELRLKVEGFPTTNYPVFLYLPERKTEWLVRNLTATAESSLDLEISKDARIARIVRKNSVENPGESPLMEEDTDTGNENTENVLAIFAPLVHKDGKIPDFQLVSDLQDPDSLSFSSPDANLDIFFRGNELRFFIGESNVPALEKTEPKNSESSLKTDRE